ncbi:hypothetical protein ACLB2K_014673 [Fragaria x ananassa]
MKEISSSSQEACSEPLSLNHHIASSVFPFFCQMVQNYGNLTLCWTETRPRLEIADPELIKSILEDKNGHIIKPPLNPLVNLLQLGVATLEGEQWEAQKAHYTCFPPRGVEGVWCMPAFETSCCSLISRWDKLAGFEGPCEVDVAPEFQNLAGDAIARTAFAVAMKRERRYLNFRNSKLF